jgi:hypothetical protein
MRDAGGYVCNECRQVIPNPGGLPGGGPEMVVVSVASLGESFYFCPGLDCVRAYLNKADALFRLPVAAVRERKEAARLKEIVKDCERMVFRAKYAHGDYDGPDVVALAEMVGFIAGVLAAGGNGVARQAMAARA